ncbi:MAG TPA: AAA family ATPase [Pyrinomonadaceae bacterium]|nr:AAA family ATPase [Pyrinomonadaceae bacterium]
MSRTNGHAQRKLQTAGPPPGDEGLRKWLENFIKENPHLTTAALARGDHIGVSRTALDQFLEGTYFLSKDLGGSGVKPETSKIERQIRAYRERVEGTVREGYANTFLQTRCYQTMVDAWAVAMTENVIVVPYGPPGIGKSRSVLELCVKRSLTRPIVILCSRNINVRYLAQRLALEAEVSDKGSIPRLEDLIADKLKKYPRPLIVDQANYLNERGLGTICHIWERARIPVMLTGTVDLFNLFMKSDLTQDVRAQLSSRVAWHIALPTLLDGEVKAIVKRALGDAATDEMVSQIMKATGGIHRHVDMIFPRINHLKKKNEAKLQAGTITMEAIVATAGARIMTG